MQKRDLKSLYSWAESIAKSSSPKKRAKEASSSVRAAPSETKQQPQQRPRKVVVDEGEEDLNLPSDTLVALRMLCAQFPEMEKISIPPFALVSQLYSCIKDRTLVDRELEVLKQKRTVRKFKLSTGQDDYAVMFLNDYFEQVKSAKKQLQGKNTQNDLVIFDWYMEHVLPTCIDVGITHKSLELVLMNAGCDLQPNHIPLLVKGGLLVRQLVDENTYWFAIPDIGILLKSLAQGRKELLSILNRRQYKEILLSLLEKKKLRMSKLGMRFHVRDLIGSGQLIKTNSPAGLLVRVAKE